MIYQFEKDYKIERCWDCPIILANEWNKDCCALSEGGIVLTQEEIYHNKPSWCPLKEVQNG